MINIVFFYIFVATFEASLQRKNADSFGLSFSLFIIIIPLHHISNISILREKITNSMYIYVCGGM